MSFYDPPEDPQAFGVSKIDPAAARTLKNLSSTIALGRYWGISESADQRTEDLHTVCKNLSAMLLLPRRTPYFRDEPSDEYDNAFANALALLEIIPGSIDSEELSNLRDQIHGVESKHSKLAHAHDGLRITLDDDGQPVVTLTIRGNWSTPEEAHACVRENAELFEVVFSVCQAGPRADDRMLPLEGERLSNESNEDTDSRASMARAQDARRDALRAGHETRAQLESLQTKGIWAGLDNADQPVVTLTIAGDSVGNDWPTQQDAINWALEYGNELRTAVSSVGKSTVDAPAS